MTTPISIPKGVSYASLNCLTTMIVRLIFFVVLAMLKYNESFSFQVIKSSKAHIYRFNSDLLSSKHIGSRLLSKKYDAQSGFDRISTRIRNIENMVYDCSLSSQKSNILGQVVRSGTNTDQDMCSSLLRQNLEESAVVGITILGLALGFICWDGDALAMFLSSLVFNTVASRGDILGVSLRVIGGVVDLMLKDIHRMHLLGIRNLLKEITKEEPEFDFENVDTTDVSSMKKSFRISPRTPVRNQESSLLNQKAQSPVQLLQTKKLNSKQAVVVDQSDSLAHVKPFTTPTATQTITYDMWNPLSSMDTLRQRLEDSKVRAEQLSRYSQTSSLKAPGQVTSTNVSSNALLQPTANSDSSPASPRPTSEPHSHRIFSVDTTTIVDIKKVTTPTGNAASSNSTVEAKNGANAMNNLALIASDPNTDITKIPPLLIVSEPVKAISVASKGIDSPNYEMISPVMKPIVNTHDRTIIDTTTAVANPSDGSITFAAKAINNSTDDMISTTATTETNLSDRELISTPIFHSPVYLEERIESNTDPDLPTFTAVSEAFLQGSNAIRNTPNETFMLSKNLSLAHDGNSAKETEFSANSDESSLLSVLVPSNVHLHLNETYINSTALSDITHECSDEGIALNASHTRERSSLDMYLWSEWGRDIEWNRLRLTGSDIYTELQRNHVVVARTKRTHIAETSPDLSESEFQPSQAPPAHSSYLVDSTRLDEIPSTTHKPSRVTTQYSTNEDLFFPHPTSRIDNALHNERYSPKHKIEEVKWQYSVDPDFFKRDPEQLTEADDAASNHEAESTLPPEPSNLRAGLGRVKLGVPVEENTHEISRNFNSTSKWAVQTFGSTSLYGTSAPVAARLSTTTTVSSSATPTATKHAPTVAPVASSIPSPHDHFSIRPQLGSGGAPLTDLEKEWFRAAKKRLEDARARSRNSQSSI